MQLGGFLKDEGTTSGFLGGTEGRNTPEDNMVPDMDEELEKPVLRVPAPVEDDE